MVGRTEAADDGDNVESVVGVSCVGLGFSVVDSEVDDDGDPGSASGSADKTLKKGGGQEGDNQRTKKKIEK